MEYKKVQKDHKAKEEYRQFFLNALSTLPKDVSVSHLLRECDVIGNNFYCFLKGDYGKVSLKKCQKIKELIILYL